MVAAAYVAYVGAFTSNYRRELVIMWLDKCREFQIPLSDSFRYLKSQLLKKTS